MKEAQFQVRCFHAKAGQTIAELPTIPSDKDAELRLKLIQEETEELALAFANHNLVEIADALGDLLYVVLGAGVTCGIQLAPVFSAIHISNMSKFIDGHKNDSGKWVKGPSYKPVNLLPILQHQVLDF